MSKEQLGIYSYTKNNKFEGFGQHHFNNEQSHLFQIKMPQSNKFKIGTLSKTNQKAYLFNGKGQLFPDFPISGSTPFEIEDLFDDGVNVLVIGHENVVFAYKLKNVLF